MPVFGGAPLNARHYVERSLELGAEDAVPFVIEDIEFDPRTILKCAFGCGDWGKGLTCPSRANSLKPWEYEKVLRKYSWGVIIHSHDKKESQRISFAIEREAFLDGYYFAFSLSDCALCAQCAGFAGGRCAHPKEARPAFHSVGIDVFKTVRKMGLPIDTLKDKDETPNWYSAVFIE
jgi:predicted metal-binding protein